MELLLFRVETRMLFAVPWLAPQSSLAEKGGSLNPKYPKYSHPPQLLNKLSQSCKIYIKLGIVGTMASHAIVSRRSQSHVNESESGKTDCEDQSPCIFTTIRGLGIIINAWKDRDVGIRSQSKCLSREANAPGCQVDLALWVASRSNMNVLSAQPDEKKLWLTRKVEVSGDI